MRVNIQILVLQGPRNFAFGGFFVDECLDHLSDGEDEENHFSTEAMRREIQQISARSSENRNRNVETGFSSNEPVPGHFVDDPEIVFDCDSLRTEAITLRHALPEAIRRAIGNVNPAQPAFVFELAQVRAKHPLLLSNEQILQLSTIELLSTCDILAKALAVGRGENSLANICGGATSAFCNQPSEYVSRGVFLIHKVPPTLVGAILFANSKEAEGGRKRAEKMKLLATIEAISRDKGRAVFVIVKDGERVVAKYATVESAEKAFHAKNMLRGKVSRVGGIDMFGVNFSAFAGSRDEFVNLPMSYDHVDRLATLKDNRLLAKCSTEVMLTRGKTVLPFTSIAAATAYSKENKHLNITISAYNVSPKLLKSAGARGILVSKQSRAAFQAPWFLKEGSRLTIHAKKLNITTESQHEYIYFEKMQDGHYHMVEDSDLLDGSATAPTAMTAPTAGGTLAGTTAPPAPTKFDIIDHSATSIATIASAKKRKAATTSAKKGKATAKADWSEDEESGSYSPSDSSDEETPAPVLARALSGRASSRAATKKGTYVETDQEISDESEGDFD